MGRREHVTTQQAPDPGRVLVGCGRYRCVGWLAPCTFSHHYSVTRRRRRQNCLHTKLAVRALEVRRQIQLSNQSDAFNAVA